MQRIICLSAMLMAACLSALPVCALAENRALLIGINDYLANDAGAAQTAGQSWIPEDLNGAVNDVAYFHFSGHGSQFDDASGDEDESGDGAAATEIFVVED